MDEDGGAAARTAQDLERLIAEVAARRYGLYIDGGWREPISGLALDVHDPATGAVLTTVGAGGPEDVDAAVRSAARAFADGEWSRLRHVDRQLLLLRLADAIEARIDEIALLESLDVGNPVQSILTTDLRMAVDGLRDNAGWATKLTGDTALSSSHARSLSYTLREPIGVVAAITPWNSPFLMAVKKLAPALAAGCTVVLKPAELAPLTTLLLPDLLEEAGFPAGAVNVVTGLGSVAGQALVDHPDVAKISFTGSTRVGQGILRSAATHMKRVTLELGGKSPVIVFPDADLDAAATATISTLFFKTGQYCAAGTRLFAHERVLDEFTARFVERAEALRIGPGTDPQTQMGPIISPAQLDRVMEYVRIGVEEGAELRTGGTRLARAGNFVAPALLTGVRPEMRVFQEEIFGPVLGAMPFTDSDDLGRIAQLANATGYGLAANIWTRDLRTAHRLSRAVQAGTISINGGGREIPLPSGGYKLSGIGRENGREGVEAFTELKTVLIGLD